MQENIFSYSKVLYVVSKSTFLLQIQYSSLTTIYFLYHSLLRLPWDKILGFSRSLCTQKEHKTEIININSKRLFWKTSYYFRWFLQCHVSGKVICQGVEKRIFFLYSNDIDSQNSIPLKRSSLELLLCRHILALCRKKAGNFFTITPLSFDISGLLFH